MMRAALIRLLTNARAFASGFLGLDAVPPKDKAAARRHFDQRAKNKPHCC
jgi:hypothetical protein